MPFLAHLCLLSADSSQSSSSIKSILRRRLFKKRTPSIPDHQQQQLSSVRTFYSRKRSIHKKKSNDKFHSTSNNYDMTILHDDELDNPNLATVRRRKKKIPSWAKKDQLELAIINQVYFQETNPDDIFGTVCIKDVFDMIDSIDIKDKKMPSVIVSRHFV